MVRVEEFVRKSDGGSWLQHSVKRGASSCPTAARRTASTQLRGAGALRGSSRPLQLTHCRRTTSSTRECDRLQDDSFRLSLAEGIRRIPPLIPDRVGSAKSECAQGPSRILDAISLNSGTSLNLAATSLSRSRKDAEPVRQAQAHPPACPSRRNPRSIRCLSTTYILVLAAGNIAR